MAACVVCSLESCGVCWTEAGLSQDNNIVKCLRTGLTGFDTINMHFYVVCK